MAFPLYHRSHLRSNTSQTLIRILSHFSAFSTSLQTPTQPISVPDNGSGRMEQENQEKESKCSEFVGSDFMDPKDPVPQMEMQEVHETIEGVGGKDVDFSSDKMVLDDIELMMGVDKMSMQANGFDKEQKLMDELELIVKGTEDLVCDSGLNLGLDEKKNGSYEVGLMDYQLDDVEFMQSDVNSSGNANLLQQPGNLNQLVAEGFDLSSMFGMSTSTEGCASALENSTCSSKHESQQKETELVESVCAEGGSLPTTEEGEFEKEEQCGQKIAEATYISFDLDMNNGALIMSEDGGLPDSGILKDSREMPDGGEELEKIICGNNAAKSSNISIEKGEMEEGEISGDLRSNDNSFYMCSADALISEVDAVQKPQNVTGNMVYPCWTGNGEREKGCESNSFMVNALQDANNSGHVKSRTSDEKGIACGIEVASSHEAVECNKASECGSLLKLGNSKDGHLGCKGINNLPTNLTQNEVGHRGCLYENATKDHGNSSTVKLVDACRKRKPGPCSEEKENKEKLVDASKKKKRGPIFEGKKERKKMKNRKKRAEKNREQGVKRLKLQPVQKPKTVPHCRHYLKGRCHEGDKCQFSHDTVPLTKSKPCIHFARHSCMKGDDCPFDHQLSNYPCTNFVSRGSCSRGDACMFSHKVPTNQDIPTPSNVAEVKCPLLSGNANFSTPLNNRGSSSVQQNHFTNSAGIHSHINAEHKVTDTIQKQPTRPKGINFINIAQLSPSPSALKQGTVTTAKESPVQIGNCADQSVFGTTQNKVEIPNKLPAVTPKGINFLSFGKGSVCSLKSPICSRVNRENGIKLPQLLNFSLPEKASSTLDKDYYNQVSDRTKQIVPQTDLFSNENIEKNQSVAEGMKLKFPWETSIDVSTRDHIHNKSVQEGKKPSDNSQTSNVNSSMLLGHPFLSDLSSKRIISGYDKHASNTGQRALLSTLAFAAEHESDIKMKYPTGV
ncbi:hypothetical protein VNO77_39947 [Canavalia gladiata]|uniref:C3H1-type domain-containing protein n=1 Tax=Canavalia gladiata TaxID=3824 RepID=A0AAN9JXC1_CANGL